MPHTRTTHHLRPYGLALLAFLAVASAGWGKVVYVNKNAPGAIHDGLSWATAFILVQPAIDAAKSGDEVWVAGGTYIENITLQAGVALYGGYAGTETARGQRDWQTNATVLADDNSSSTVVTSRYLGTVLDGFTVRGNGSSYGVYGGDTVANCVVSGHNYGIYGSTFVTNCTISGNNYGAYNVATVANCTISGSHYAGVEVYVYHTASITNSVITGNGAGVNLYYGTANLTNCAISGNGVGADVFSGKVSVTNCTLTANGYGVSTEYEGTANIINCIVASNATGIYKYPTGGVVSPFHNDVYGNTTANYSGMTDPTGTNGNISLDPLFVNRSGSNLRVQAGSPCIDAGDDAVVKAGQLDLDGGPRISGPHVDIGAYEYTGAAVPYTFAEAAAALKIAGGLVNIPASDIARLNPEAALNRVDLADAVRIARKVAGLEPNP